MTKLQNSYRDMWNRVRDYLNQDPNFVMGLQDVAPMYTLWVDKLNLWDPLAARQATDGGDVATHKKEALATAAALCSKWGRRCSVAALQLGLYSVESTLNHRAYEIMAMKADNAYHLMLSMRDALASNMQNFSVQGLNASVMTEIEAKLEALNALLLAPQQSSEAHEALTMQLQQLRVELNADLEPIIQLLEAEYEDTNQDFVTGLMLAHELGTPAGKRYTGMEGVVRVNGVAAAGYKVVRKGLDGKRAVTDIMGHYALRSMRGGTYEFELQNAQGVRMDSAVIRVLQGTTVVRDWEVNVTN